MKKIRIIARVITHDQEKNSILLVRNKGTKFWYPPGGAWETDKETITQCAKREVYEETGIKVDLQRFLYAQEFHESEETTFLELFWMAHLKDKPNVENHTDLDINGQVEEACWFKKEELAGKKVFPKELKERFWNDIKNLAQVNNQFLGIF
ncbi:MAG: NUDIX hydrolase [bacterium]|nr:NUDIX hydrolase [bacterium]MDZ4285785.1 NUDIX hydrolase [Candidatus Sungbacteria bacterium]